MTLTDVALQNLRRRKGKTFFLLFTFILIVGIAVALNVLTASMQADLEKTLTQYGANLVITPKSQHFALSYGGLSVPGVDYKIQHLNKDVVTTISQTPGLGINGIAPKIIGLATGNNNASRLIVGVDFPTELKMKPWWHIQGKTPADGEIVVGAKIANTENLKIGDTLVLNRQNYPVVGVMQATGGSEDNAVFADFKTAGTLTGTGSWSMIEINSVQPDKTAAQLSTLLPQAKVAELSQLVQETQESVERFSSFSLITSILLGVIGILIVFVTTIGNVNDRISEIGIFRAIGFRQRHVLSLLIREITIVSLAGGVLGYLLGELSPSLLGPLLFQKTVSLQFQPYVTFLSIGLPALSGIVSVVLGMRILAPDPAFSKDPFFVPDIPPG